MNYEHNMKWFYIQSFTLYIDLRVGPRTANPRIVPSEASPTLRILYDSDQRPGMVYAAHRCIAFKIVFMFISRLYMNYRARLIYPV